MAALLAGAAMLGACNTLEVTMPRGPQGEQGLKGEAGKDGLSAYEIWVNSVKDHSVQDWSGGTAVTDFFKYLKGKDGVNGKDGADGKDGVDGKTAYELWVDYVASGVEDPKNPGMQWDRTRTTEKDFYDFLSGSDGDNGSTPYIGSDGNWWIVVDGIPKDLGVPARGPKGDDGQDGEDGHTGASPTIGENGNWWIGSVDTGIPVKGEKGDQGQDGKDGAEGLSAYDLWVADVKSDGGLPNPGNGVYDPEEYPCWPKDATSVEDFYRYLSGKDGKDGEGAKPQEDDGSYMERVDGTRYNVSPVISMSKGTGGPRTYEYVNPFSGGAAFIVTGPGPVIIPDCEVTFTTMDGTVSYTKTSDASGYVYLTRSELPDWYEGAPSAADDSTDISSGVKPLSFTFGDRKVTDASKIAPTCKVPYKVGLGMEIVGGSLRNYRSLVRYEVHRIVEGRKEEEPFVMSSPRGIVDDYRGCGYLHTVPASFRYYRNEGAVRAIRAVYATAQEIGNQAPSSAVGDSEMLSFFSTISRLSPGEVPSQERSVGSESTYSPSFGDGANPEKVSVDDPFVYLNKGTLLLRNLRPDYGLSVKDRQRKVHVPSIARLPETIRNASYVWKSGHTTLTFELDWDAIDALEVVDQYSGAWDGDVYSYGYEPFGELSGRPESLFSSFSAKGKFNGSVIDSKVGIAWRKPVVFTDIYDDFSVTVADVTGGAVLFKGMGGKFKHDASQDDEEGNGTAWMFGQEIRKTLDHSGQ